MVLACVIAKDWKDDQCHLVGQMIGNGEPLHARGQADEMLLSFGLNVIASFVCTFHLRLVNLRECPLLTLSLVQIVDVTLHEVRIMDVPGHLMKNFFPLS